MGVCGCERCGGNSGCIWGVSECELLFDVGCYYVVYLLAFMFVVDG